ncbi:MAG: carboxypeptidase-like regulatory domain-containing protein, partial [Acidobacteria bacterium]|nr:carboxypeptidase-like regulatory domain-containing protein [Acidobacteriota bacterium]
MTNTDQNLVVRTLKTGAQGTYIVPLLAVGRYSVKVEAKGFQTRTVKDIEVNVNLTASAPVTMTPGQVTQTVTVTANQLAPQLETSAAGTLIAPREMTQVPLSSRNIVQMLYLQPGISSGVPGPDIRGNITSAGAVNAQNFHVNGLSQQMNGFYLDGQDEIKRLGQQDVAFPGLDLVQEMNLQRSSYGAQYAGPGGAVISLTTKTGTTAFHGGAYEFFRSQVLNANTYFNNLAHLPRPGLRYNDYGYEVGGPVWIPHVTARRNTKTFFFFGQELLRLESPVYDNITNIPTATQRQGIFSAPVCVAYNAKGQCTGSATSIQNLDPTAQAYLKDIINNVPLPNNPNDPQGLIAYEPGIQNETQTMIRIDHQFSQRLSAFFRYFDEPSNLVAPNGFTAPTHIPGIGTSDISDGSTSYLASATYLINANNVLVGGYGYRANWVTAQPIGSMLASKNPDIHPVLPYSSIGVEVPGVVIHGSNYAEIVPYDERDPVTQIFLNDTSTLGRHTLLFGFNLEYENDGSTTASGISLGQFTFNNTPLPIGSTATVFDQAFANFLLGKVSTFSQASKDIAGSVHSNIYEAYADDDFHVTPRLSADFGVRYSYLALPSNGQLPGHAFNPLVNFDPPEFNGAHAPAINSLGLICTQAPCLGGATPNPEYNPLNGLIIGAKNSPYGSKVTRQPNLTFAPRFGFAYDLSGKGRAVLRGGFGVFYLQQITNEFKNGLVNSNPPNVATTVISNTSFAAPGNGIPVLSDAPQQITAFQANAAAPYNQAWSLDLQKELGNSMLLDIGYYGSHAAHMGATENLNQPLPGLYVQNGIIPGNTVTSGNTQRLNQIRPYLGYAAITATENLFSSNYNGLQVSFQKRVQNGMLIAANYTYSKALGNDNTPQNIYNIQSDYTTEPSNRTNIFNLHFVYPLPFYRNQHSVVGHLLGGWETAGIFYSGSGTFLNATTLGVDPGGVGILAGPAAGRPDYISNPNTHASHSLRDWFNGNAFAQVPAGQYRPGNDGVNNIKGPGYEEWDLSMYKNMKIYESLTMQLRAESFNTFNHTNFTSLNAVLGNA